MSTARNRASQRGASIDEPFPDWLTHDRTEFRPTRISFSCGECEGTLVDNDTGESKAEICSRSSLFDFGAGVTGGLTLSFSAGRQIRRCSPRVRQRDHSALPKTTPAARPICFVGMMSLGAPLEMCSAWLLSRCDVLARALTLLQSPRGSERRPSRAIPSLWRKPGRA